MKQNTLSKGIKLVTLKYRKDVNITVNICVFIVDVENLKAYGKVIVFQHDVQKNHELDAIHVSMVDWVTVNLVVVHVIGVDMVIVIHTVEISNAIRSGD